MVSSGLLIKNFLKPISLILLTALFAPFSFASEMAAETAVEKKADLGIIKGIVRDDAGNPIADATVAFFRVGTSKLLKQVRSAANGNFLARMLPGTYKVLAVAQGFNPVTISEVEVNRSAELVYGFKLERSGSGNTLPEKRVDRNNPKWIIRSAQTSRSIYQVDEDGTPIDENTVAETKSEEETKSERKGQTVVESYFADSKDGNVTGLNFARLQPLTENSEIVIAGQIGAGNDAPKRFEANLKFRPVEAHQIHVNGSIVNIGKIKTEKQEKSLGQISFQAMDEWKVKSGIIVVFGFDYSRFIGAGSDFSISPRLGLQFDINSKTRFRTSYTTQNEDQGGWQRAIEMEDSQILFREPVSMQDIFVENDAPQMNKSTRLEFGIERVLDNKSSIEANAFFDTVSGRGVGLTALPIDILSGANFSEFTANQQGSARGIRVVYTRRLNGTFSTSAGYAFGNGQKLSMEAVSNPANVFEADFFQTFFGQFDADFSTGTQIKTIFRLSPQATVFAIDPFQGRMAIYDPNLSVMVTQSLPTLGLPIRAEAIIDARNLFDSQANVTGEEGILRLNSKGRVLRGGISVRF